MKYRWFVGGGVVAAALVVAIVFWQRAQAQEPDPRTLADKIATGKAFEMGGKELSIKPHAPAAEYFALPPGPQRDAYLDKMIDMQEETRKKLASGEIQLPPGVKVDRAQGNKIVVGKGDASGEKLPTSVEEKTSADGTQKSVTVRLNADDLSPTLRAQMNEFAAAMRHRRKERGLDPDAPMMIIRSEIRTEKK